MYRCFQIVNRFPQADFRTLAVHSGLCCSDWSCSLVFVADLSTSLPGISLWNLVALVQFMRPSLRKGAYASFSSVVWQEIRVRFGRDDTSVRNGGTTRCSFSSPWVGRDAERLIWKDTAGAKSPTLFCAFAARLKSCPDTKRKSVCGQA